MKKNPFTGIRTAVLMREIQRRDSIAYARNVNREFRGLRAQREIESRNS